MPSIAGAERESLERFAARVTAEHRATRQGVCGGCYQWSPCPVERAAIETGLVHSPVTLANQNPAWEVKVDDATVRCTPLARGKGRIITFERSAVEAGNPGTAAPWDPVTRSAWNEARREVLERRLSNGV